MDRYGRQEGGAALGGNRTSLVCAGKLQRNGDSMYKSRGINRYQPDIWRLVREIAARRACRCTSETCTSRTSPFCRKCSQAALTAARMGTADGRPVRDQDKVYPSAPCKNGPGRGFYGKRIMRKALSSILLSVLLLCFGACQKQAPEPSFPAVRYLYAGSQEGNGFQMDEGDDMLI